MQKIQITGFLFENMLHWQYEVGEGRESTYGCFRLHIYLHTTKSLIHNSLYVFGNWREKLKTQKDALQLQ